MLKKRFGQHFLCDETITRKSIAAIAPQPIDTIIEIGAGGGALTKHLLAAGATVIAVEVDRDWTAFLKKTYGDALQVVTADVLSLDLPALAAAGTRVVGNLPYNISTPFLLKLAVLNEWMRDGFFMLQKEVGARLAADVGGGDYGRLSVTLQRMFAVETVLTAPAAAFKPPPQVDSVFVRMQPKTVATPPRCFDDVVRDAFLQRRKTLRNALAAWQVDWTRCPIDSQRRAQTLSADDFILLCDYVSVK